MKFMITQDGVELKDIFDPSAILDTVEEAGREMIAIIENCDDLGVLAVVVAPEGIRAVETHEELMDVVSGKGYPNA